MRVQPKRILVVEDNDLLARALVLALVQEGHTVEIASSAADALALSASFAPEVAIVNLSLPDLAGDELARQLRAAIGQLRVVGLTASPEASLAATQRQPFDAVVEKPFVVGDIVRVL